MVSPSGPSAAAWTLSPPTSPPCLVCKHSFILVFPCEVFFSTSCISHHLHLLTVLLVSSPCGSVAYTSSSESEPEGSCTALAGLYFVQNVLFSHKNCAGFCSTFLCVVRCHSTSVTHGVAAALFLVCASRLAALPLCARAVPAFSGDVNVTVAAVFCRKHFRLCVCCFKESGNPESSLPPVTVCPLFHYFISQQFTF